MKNIYEIKYLKYSATKYRNHVGVSFFIVLKGEAMITVKNVRTFYEEGDTFIVKHNECYKLDVWEGNIVVQIHFYRSLIETLVPELLCNHCHVRTQKEILPLRNQLIYLCCLYLTRENNRNFKIMKQIISVLEIYKEKLHIDDEDHSIIYEDVSPIIEEIKDYIYEHYNERITINTFTNKYHLSESYFSKMFKEQMGVNFKDYLTDIRLVNSIYDLIHTHEKVIDISEKHGFHNVSAYIHAFKLYYGVTPKKYRNMIQNKHAQFERHNFFNEVDNERNLTLEEIKFYLRKFKQKYTKTVCAYAY